MRFIILDQGSGALLYGHQELESTAEKESLQQVKVFHMPAEAWIAALKTTFTHIPAVNEYLKAVEDTETINPNNGKLLEAVDDAIEFSNEDVERVAKIVEEADLK
jgi:hypothetical protein